MALFEKTPQLLETAAWRLFSCNWIPIGLMALALTLSLTLTNFSIRAESMLLPFGAAALYTGVAYYNARLPHKREPLVVFVLGSSAQILFITLIMTPLSYVAASSALPMTDAGLEHLDRALGLDWRGYFDFFYDRPRLVPALAFGYRMIALPVFVIPLALTLGRRYRRLQEFTLAFALALVATTLISIFTPAIGAYDQLGIKPDPSVLSPGGYLDTLRDLPLVRDGSLRELDIGKLVGIITFPSFHAAAAILYLWAMWSVWWVRPFGLIANGAMLVATPIGGGHYFVDVFAGVAVAIIAIAGALRISAWLAGPERQCLVAAESTATQVRAGAGEAVEIVK